MSISCLSRCLVALLLVVLGGLHVSLLDVLPLSLPPALASCTRNEPEAPTPRLMLSQILSEVVSNALLFPSASIPSAHSCPGPCDVQLEAESGAEDGEQHGRVAAEDRAGSMVSRARSRHMREGRLACRQCRASAQGC